MPVHHSIFNNNNREGTYYTYTYSYTLAYTYTYSYTLAYTYTYT